MLIEYPLNSNGQRQLVSRIQRPYKMAKFEKQLFKQNPYLKANRKKWLISQSCYFVKKHFLASNFFMQTFNESILCSIELFRHKLWYKLNSPDMHYLYTSYKIAKLDKQPFC